MSKEKKKPKLSAYKKEHAEHQKDLKPLLAHLKSDENKLKIKNAAKKR